MSIFAIYQAKTNLSKLIQKAAAGQKELIARGAKPVARLVALSEVKGKRIPGSLKGTLHVGPDFFETLPGNELTRCEWSIVRIAGYAWAALVAF